MPIITRYSRPGTSQAMKRMPSAAPNSWSVERAYRRTDSFDRRRWPPSADEAETAIDRDMQHYSGPRKQWDSRRRGEALEMARHIKH